MVATESAGTQSISASETQHGFMMKGWARNGS